jgi:hypothetical protein
MIVDCRWPKFVGFHPLAWFTTLGVLSRAASPHAAQYTRASPPGAGLQDEQRISAGPCRGRSDALIISVAMRPEIEPAAAEEADGVTPPAFSLFRRTASGKPCAGPDRRSAWQPAGNLIHQRLSRATGILSLVRPTGRSIAGTFATVRNISCKSADKPT